MATPRTPRRTKATAKPAPAVAADDASNGTPKLVLRDWMGLREALLAALAGVLAHAHAQAARAADGPGAAVHEFRKSVRRARAAVALVQPLVGREAARALTGELRDALGAVSHLRDADVLVATLDRVEAPEDLAPTVAALRAALETETDAIRARSDVAALLAAGATRLPLVTERLADALPPRALRSDLENGLARLLRRAGSAFTRALRKPDDDRIHDWRKRVKELRYALELLDSERGEGKTEEHRVTAKLAEGLGEVTDFIVLHRRLEAMAADVKGTGAVCRVVEERVRTGFDGMTALGRDLFGRRPKKVAAGVLAACGGG